MKLKNIKIQIKNTSNIVSKQLSYTFNTIHIHIEIQKTAI